MKKTVAILVTTAILMGSTTTAFATTTTSASNDAMIAQLQAQIALLMEKITALKQAQGAVQTAQKDVAGTMQLIGDLKEGMTGEQVKLLQTILAGDKTIYPEGTVSGYYGRLTKAAVKRFQKEHGIEGTGYVGPKTMRKINELLQGTPIMKNDDSDNDDDDSGQNRERNRERNQVSEFCVAVPPGHLIAPGWRKHHDGDDEDPVLPRCKTIPPGIWNKFDKGTTTPDTAAPVLSAIVGTATGATTATVTWTTNELATTKVYYGTTSPLNTATALTQSNTALSKTHAVNLSGLTASTAYYVIIESRDVANNVATSAQISFTTTAAPDTTAPVLSAVAGTATGSTTATVTWTTNELATSKVYYSTTTPVNMGSALMQNDTALVTAHSVGLSGLSASTTYYVIASSLDAANNVGTSTEFSFVTPQ